MYGQLQTSATYFVEVSDQPVAAWLLSGANPLFSKRLLSTSCVS